MTPGDFCFIPRTDGRFALFVYLCPQGKSRSCFYGAIATELVNTDSADGIPTLVSVGEHALVHIQCYSKNETPICGNLADRLTSGVLDNISAAIYDTEIGSNHKVWGYKTIVKYANLIST